MTNFDSDMRCAYVDIGHGAGGECKNRQKGGVYCRVILAIYRNSLSGLSMKETDRRSRGINCEFVELFWLVKNIEALQNVAYTSDRLCGLVVRVSGYQIF